ncbi:MAG TPA: alpha/beta hydrolase, partial [Gaiellaceae bacterium]|nr:alpha/beta hydrolase [Gaiellaceae bacterium]
MAEAAAVAGHVGSPDGTRIGYRRSGAGPPLVLVHGATSAHWSFRFVVPILVERFTVYAIDRRGRGDSGDRTDHAIEHEFQDVAAIVDSIGEPASLFGHSYGATVALGGALEARNLHKLILYEPAPGFSAVANDDIERIEELIAREEREQAVLHAFHVFGLTAEELEQLRASPTWPARVAAAHTLVREIRAEEAYRVHPERFRNLAAPTLLLLGDESPEWAREGTERVRAVLQDARVAILPGQGHAA